MTVVLVRGGRAPGRSERHEEVRGRIDSFEVNRLERLEPPGPEGQSDPFVSPGRRQHRPELIETALGLSRPALTSSWVRADEPSEILVGHGLRRRDERRDLGEQLGRMGLPLRASLADGGLPEELVGDAVGDHVAVHALGRPRGPPSDDPHRNPSLTQEVPDGPDLSLTAGDGDLPPRPDVFHQKIEYAVLGREKPGCDRRPDDGRKGRRDRLQAGSYPFPDESGEVRQLAFPQKVVDDLPVGPVKPQHQESRPGHRMNGLLARPCPCHAN